MTKLLLLPAMIAVYLSLGLAIYNVEVKTNSETDYEYESSFKAEQREAMKTKERIKELYETIQVA